MASGLPLATPLLRKNRSMSALVVAIWAMSCLTLSGCDKCGDWFWQGSTKSCRDQSQVK